MRRLVLPEAEMLRIDDCRPFTISRMIASKQCLSLKSGRISTLRLPFAKVCKRRNHERGHPNLFGKVARALNETGVLTPVAVEAD